MKKTNPFDELMRCDLSQAITPDQKKRQILFELLKVILGLLDREGKFDIFLDCKNQEWKICTYEETKQMKKISS